MKKLTSKSTKTIAGGNKDDRTYGEEAKDFAKHTADEVLKGINYANDKLAEGLIKLSEKIEDLRQNTAK